MLSTPNVEKSPPPASSPYSARRDTDAHEDPDTVLLEHVWFPRKRTGEDFSRTGHAVAFSALLFTFTVQIVMAHTSSMLRENAVGVTGERCSTGCFRWSCGDNNGYVGSNAACSKYSSGMTACKITTAGGLVLNGLAAIVEAAEMARPGILSTQYRKVATGFLVGSSVLFFVSVLVVFIVWAQESCGVQLRASYQLAHGWSITLMNAFALLFTSYHVWTSKRVW